MMLSLRVFPHFVVSAAARALLLFASVAVFPGCSNDPNPKPLAEKRPDGSPWLVRYGAMGDDPRSLDPQVSYDQMSRRVLEPVQDCLLEYHPMKTDPYEVIPGLLTAVPEPVRNADGTVTYLCQLKQGILFHDDPCFPGEKGRELVASDALYSFQRICDPKVESPILSNLQEYIAGMGEAYEAAKKNNGRFDYSQPLRGVEVVDRYTFKLHLLKPYPQILYWMAMHATAPVAREAVEYYDGKAHPAGKNGETVVRPLFKMHPVGTGPFRMHEYVPGQRVRLVRNPNYKTSTFPTEGWPAEKDALLRPLAGRQLPLVDEVQLTIFRESLPVWLLARQGYLDGMGVSKDAFDAVITASRELSPKYAQRGMRLEKDIEPSTFYLSLNLQDPVLGPNKKLRQALSCAFNAQGWVDIFASGVPPVAQQLIPPGIFSYQKDFRNPYGFDLEKGRRLIAEAGYPNGIDPATGRPLEITMDVTATGGSERQSAEYDQRQFEQLGIRVRVIENNFARMLEKQDQGNFQIASGTGWGADYPDPENFFFLFYSKNLPPMGKNINRYVNPEFDRLFDQMATMENSPERFEVVRKMNDILMEDCAAVFTFHRAYYVLVQPFAPRTHSNAMLEGGLKYAVIDQPLREVKQREWNPQPVWPLVAMLGVVAAGAGYALHISRRRNV